MEGSKPQRSITAMKRWYLPLAFWLTLAAGPAAVAEPYEGPYQSGRADGTFIPRPTLPPGPELGPDSSCEALYAELNRLVPHTHDTRPGFSSNPVNTAISAVSGVFPGALILLAGTLYADLLEQQEIDSLKARVQRLRDWSGAKRCWVQ